MVGMISCLSSVSQLRICNEHLFSHCISFDFLILCLASRQEFDCLAFPIVQKISLSFPIHFDFDIVQNESLSLSQSALQSQSQSLPQSLNQSAPCSLQNSRPKPNPYLLHSLHSPVWVHLAIDLEVRVDQYSIL